MSPDAAATAAATVERVIRFRFVPLLIGYARVDEEPAPDDPAEVGAVDIKVEEFRPAVEEDAVTVGDPCPAVRGVWGAG